MAELNIIFSGICTHLYGVVPGVPMRSVLPNATGVEFGVVSMPDQSGPMFYYLLPHVARISDGYGPSAWTRLLTGSYIRVTNAKDQPFRRQSGGFSLTEFVPNVSLSTDVVFGGKALAYFDIFGARVWHEGGPNTPHTTHVSISTDGPPEISLTPMADTPLPQPDTRIVENELYITNLDLYPAGEDSQFDFLKNYLVTGGLPPRLLKPTPGLDTPPPAQLTLRRFGERLKGLGMYIETQGGTVAGWRDAQAGGVERGTMGMSNFGPNPANPYLGILAQHVIDPVPLNQSCSDCQYP